MSNKIVTAESPQVPAVLTPIEKKIAAMEKVGATREKAYQAMVEALSSVTMSIDKYGEEHITPDTSNRLKAAEMIAKAHGDYANTQINIENNTTFTFAAMIEMANKPMPKVKDA